MPRKMTAKPRGSEISLYTRIMGGSPVATVKFLRLARGALSPRRWPYGEKYSAGFSSSASGVWDGGVMGFRKHFFKLGETTCN